MTSPVLPPPSVSQALSQSKVHRHPLKVLGPSRVSFFSKSAEEESPPDMEYESLFVERERDSYFTVILCIFSVYVMCLCVSFLP